MAASDPEIPIRRNELKLNCSFVGFERMFTFVQRMHGCLGTSR